MAVDEALTARMRDALDGLGGVSEKKMMGGICFLLDGNMIGGAHRDKKTGEGLFMFRVGKENEAAGQAMPGARPMDFTGRKMSGFFFVSEEDASDQVLADWVALALSFVGSLPPKEK